MGSRRGTDSAVGGVHKNHLHRIGNGSADTEFDDTTPHIVRKTIETALTRARSRRGVDRGHGFMVDWSR